MKGNKLYNTNPALNKWEEERFAKLMAKKIKGAKSVVSANKGPSSPSQPRIRSSTSRSSSPAVGVRSAAHTSNSQQLQPASTQPQQQPDSAATVAAAGEILEKLQELLQLPLLQQLQQLQLPAHVSNYPGVQQPQVTTAVAEAADPAASGNPLPSGTQPDGVLQDLAASPPVTNSTNSNGAAMLSPQDLIRIAQAATALLQTTDPSKAAAALTAAGAGSRPHTAAAAAAVDAVTGTIAAGNGRPSSGSGQGRSSKPGSSSGRKPKPNSRGSSRGDGAGSKPQKAKPVWDEHWWETPLSEAADGGTSSTNQQQNHQQQQQQKKPRPGELIPARTTSPAVGARAAGCNGTTAAASRPRQEHEQQQISSNVGKQQPRMLSKQSSAREGAGSRPVVAAIQRAAVGGQGAVAAAAQPRHQAGPNVASTSKAAAAAALARLRGGSTTAAAGAGTGSGPPVAEPNSKFKVKLLPVRAPAHGSSSSEIQLGQTTSEGIQPSGSGSRSSSAGVNRRFSEGASASMSSRSCSSPARYSNPGMDDEESPRSGESSCLRFAAAANSAAEAGPWSAVDAHHRASAARAAAASPVDVLTSSLMTLNDLIKHKVKDLQQQQQSQQAPGHSPQQGLLQQQRRGLGSDSGDLMGLSMQQSELLLMPGEADPLGMSDLAFLDRGQQAYHAGEAGSAHDLKQQQQHVTQPPSSSQQQQVTRCRSESGPLATAEVAQAPAAAAATAAEDEDMVLLGTLPGSFTVARGAAGLEALYNMLTTATGTNAHADQLHQQCQTVSDAGSLQHVQQQQQLLCAPGADGYVLHESVRTTGSGRGPMFQVIHHAATGAADSGSDNGGDESGADVIAGSDNQRVGAGGGELHNGDGGSSQREGGSSQGADDYADDWEDGSAAGSELTSEGEPLQQDGQDYDEAQLHDLQQSVELQRQAEQLTEGLQQLQLLVEASRGQM